MSLLTVVTAYYEIASKHTPEDYWKWITNLLNTVQTPIILFTSRSLLKRFVTSVERLQGRLVVVPLELEDLWFAQPKFLPYWEQNKKKDTVPNRSTDLYIVWHSKFTFVQMAIQNGLVQTDYVVWCDVGVMREENLLQYRSGFGSTKSSGFGTWIPNDSRLTVLQFRPLPVGAIQGLDQLFTTFTDQSQFIGAGIMGAPLQTWTKVETVFRMVTEMYWRAGRFNGSDQITLAGTILLFPGLFRLVPSGWPEDRDRWFEMLDWYNKDRH
jgi:hypothetical protein